MKMLIFDENGKLLVRRMIADKISWDYFYHLMAEVLKEKWMIF
jgi:isopentenyldiphosphate isomerase